MRVLLEIKTSSQRVRPHSTEDPSGQLGGKHADHELVFRPREGAPLIQWTQSLVLR